MPELAAPTQDERSMGLLVHILAIFSGFLAPLIIYAVKRDSKFVSFHALQSLFWHLLYGLVGVMLMMLFFVVFFTTMFSHQNTGVNPPPALFLLAPVFWMAWFVFWTVNLVLGIIFAVKSHAGQWTSYPLVGNWVRRILEI
jgi:uncharacterized Tic20 family protein